MAEYEFDIPAQKYGFGLPKTNSTLDSSYSRAANSTAFTDTTTDASSLGLGAGAAASVFSTVGQIYSSYNAYKIQAQYQRSIARINAMLLDFAEKQTYRERDEALAAQKRKEIQTIGAQRAGYAAQGVSLTDGTPLAVQRSTNFLGEIDAIRIRLNAARQAFGFQMRALDATMKSEIAAQSADSRASATLLGGGVELTRQGAEFAYKLER